MKGFWRSRYKGRLIRLVLYPIVAGLLLLFLTTIAIAQIPNQIPINIKVQEVVVKTGTQYQFYLPSGEFHGRLEKDLTHIILRADVDYDYIRGDVGFAIGHIIRNRYFRPGLFLRDDLLFRPIYSNTRLWIRKQGVVITTEKELKYGLGFKMTVKNDHQKTPHENDYSKLASFTDRTLRFEFSIRHSLGKSEEYRGQVSVEQGLELLGGDFGYTLLESFFTNQLNIGSRIKWHMEFLMEGNVTGERTPPPASPLYFLGGRSTLIGYENDEFWGKKRTNLRNHFSFVFLPGMFIDYNNFKIGYLSLLWHLDTGVTNNTSFLVEGSPFKVGVASGLGLRLNLFDLAPIDISFLVAKALDVNRRPKFFVGFGG